VAWAGQGVRVNGITPGGTATEMVARERRRGLKDRINAACRWAAWPSRVTLLR
jgi:NAD(P)-dependent dehydrogenase (short-subunit alcohol dehydrogenase family)